MRMAYHKINRLFVILFLYAGISQAGGRYFKKEDFV